jgi:hypothetical protein
VPCFVEKYGDDLVPARCLSYRMPLDEAEVCAGVADKLGACGSVVLNVVIGGASSSGGEAFAKGIEEKEEEISFFVKLEVARGINLWFTKARQFLIAEPVRHPGRELGGLEAAGVLACYLRRGDRSVFLKSREHLVAESCEESMDERGAAASGIVPSLAACSVTTSDIFGLFCLTN